MREQYSMLASTSEGSFESVLQKKRRSSSLRSPRLARRSALVERELKKKPIASDISTRTKPWALGGGKGRRGGR